MTPSFVASIVRPKPGMLAIGGVKCAWSIMVYRPEGGWTPVTDIIRDQKAALVELRRRRRITRMAVDSKANAGTLVSLLRACLAQSEAFTEYLRDELHDRRALDQREAMAATIRRIRDSNSISRRIRQAIESLVAL